MLNLHHISIVFPVRGIQDELDGGGDAGRQLALRHILARRFHTHRRAEICHPTTEDRAGIEGYFDS